MIDRFKYSEVRQKIIDDIRLDLIGPREEEEILEESPKFAYLVGMLDIQKDENSVEDEQEVDADMAYEDGEDYTAGEEDDNEPIMTTHFQIPSSMGISFYVENTTKTISIDVSWGDYVKSSKKYEDEDGKEHSKIIYTRIPMTETIELDLSDSNRTKEYKLVSDSNVHLHMSKIGLKGQYSLITVYIVNKRNNPENAAEEMMFQVHLKAYAKDNSYVFLAEHICREILAEDEFYFEQRPILGRGRGCAAVWDEPINGKSTCVESAFIPENEFPGVNAALDGFDENYFSTSLMASKGKKDEILVKLNTLADSYANWIEKTLKANSRMKDEDFANKIGNNVISRCLDALTRIREGIHVIETDEIAFEAFRFMNMVIYYQNSIKNYSKKNGVGIDCNFKEFVNPKDSNNNFGWRPFQIAFILMNLSGIVNPKHKDREIVDLLYFPTGGGKTEAYLGLMAFVIANRRLRANSNAKYNADGGVTVMLRYTLRLLTTQQRDRITKMVVAAELTRRRMPEKYGNEPISIGFWVGGGVTPNKFDEFIEKPDYPSAARSARNKVFKQLLTCPFCGKPLKEENFNIEPEKKSIEIYCSDEHCEFYRYKDNRIPIPVYLVDEEIYAKCPTIILSTVDKFARLPWDVNTNALFGRVDRKCSRDGYFNSIRELGGAVRLLQDDIPKRIKRIKNKYGLEKQRFLNRNVEITSRMSSYQIPEKLKQLETTCESKDCLDTAVATNMIAVGMDVDRLGLMVVTGQPKQNSEYIQATSRIGRKYPGLVVTLYNAYRPRDLSHYENFSGYHSQLYRFVEGTTATPFSARARDRVLHAVIISAIRLKFPNLANNADASAIASLTNEEIDEVKELILERLNIIKPAAKADASDEIDQFIDWWKLRAAQEKPLRYYVVGTERYNRLMNPYDKPHVDTEKPTLQSMREVESSANMYYYTED